MIYSSPLPMPYEYVYNAPLPVVNAAVHYRCALWHHGNPLSIEQSPGAVIYRVATPINVTLLIHVLYRSENITSVVLTHVIETLPPKEVWLSLLREHSVSLTKFLTDIRYHIIEAMRYTNPDVGMIKVEGITPPIPTLDGGWDRIFDWQAMYARHWNDDQLAHALHVESGSVRNARSKLGRPRFRPPQLTADDMLSEQPKVTRGRKKKR